MAIARPTVGYHLGHLRILLFQVYGSIYVTPEKIASVSCWQHPPPFKMYGEGGAGNFSSETGIIVLTFLVKLRDYLKRWGVLLIHFQYLASNACLEKCGEGVSYIDFARPWIFDAHRVFLGNLTK